MENEVLFQPEVMSYYRAKQDSYSSPSSIFIIVAPPIRNVLTQYFGLTLYTKHPAVISPPLPLSLPIPLLVINPVATKSHQ